MPPNDFTLPHDIGSPEEYLPGTPLWVWLTVAALLIGLLLLCYLLIRRLSSKKAQPPALGPDHYIIAAQRLEALKENQSTMPIGRFATATSLILRECLAQVLNDPALYETDEEMAIRLQSLDRVPPSVRAFLLDLSSAKYAPSQTDEDQASQFLEQGSAVLREVYQSQSQTPPQGS